MLKPEQIANHTNLTALELDGEEWIHGITRHYRYRLPSTDCHIFQFSDAVLPQSSNNSMLCCAISEESTALTTHDDLKHHWKQSSLHNHHQYFDGTSPLCFCSIFQSKQSWAAKYLRLAEICESETEIVQVNYVAETSVRPSEQQQVLLERAKIFISRLYIDRPSCVFLKPQFRRHTQRKHH